MIFKDTCSWIFGVSPHTGKPKTQTRRPIRKEFETLQGIKQGFKAVLWPNGHIRYKVGNVYKVQPGRGKHSVGNIKLVDIRYDFLTIAISMGDAIAEGFATPQDFCDVWKSLYGKDALLLDCWVLVFEPLDCVMDPIVWRPISEDNYENTICAEFWKKK